MHSLVAIIAVVWTAWIAVLLTAGGILLLIGILVMYLKKVVAPQYPNRD